jgi:hypothetical protein
VGPWEGVLAMTLVVRDEEDVIAANLDYHLAQGVDVILVVDHGSRDSTPEILRRYGQTDRVRCFREEAEDYEQVEYVNRLTRVAADSYRADWIIHCDADEFWMPKAGTLRDVFAAVPDSFGYLRVERNDFVPVPDDGRPFHERMLVRERRSLSVTGLRLWPKVAQRPAAGAGVQPGNHDLEAPVMAAAPDIGAIEIGHFQMRTFEQFERKVVRLGTVHERRVERTEDENVDEMELLRMHRSGELRRYYNHLTHGQEQLARGIAEGRLVVDERVRHVLANRERRLVESPSIQALLRHTWLLVSSVNEERLAAEASVRALRSQLDQAIEQREGLIAEMDEVRGGAAQLADALTAVRRSRLMRYSAPVRRMYYRLRPFGGPPR